jgi:hypothetical protein
VVLPLGATLHAFGAYLSLAALLIAVTMTGVWPTPPRRGAWGVAEAVLILALAADGIVKNEPQQCVFSASCPPAFPPSPAGSASGGCARGNICDSKPGIRTANQAAATGTRNGAQKELICVPPLG